MPAENIASNWIQRLKSVVWLLSLIDIIFLKGKGGNAADIALNCPDPFTEGQINIITYAINSTAIKNAGCATTPSSLVITFIFTSGLQRPLCSSQYPPASCGPNSTARACFCAVNNTDVFTYQYNFLGDIAYDGGDFTYDICLVPSQPPTEEISPNCTTIKFETTTTAAATTTTTNTTAVTANSSTNSTEAPRPCGLCAWCIALIVLSPIFLLIGVVILVLIIIWICGWCQRAWKRKSDNQKTAWGIAGIIVAVLILALGVIAVIVASIKSETCEGWCCIANIVLGSFCIAIGLVIVILLILIMCECIKRKRKEQHENDNSDSPHLGPDDPGPGKAAERGNKTNLKKSKDTPLSETPSSGSGEPQHTGLQSITTT